MSWQCRACGHSFPRQEGIGRRDLCPSCGAELRSCRQCTFYDPGAYNDCREPQAERVLDKKRANFCDYYEPASSGAAQAEAGKRRSADEPGAARTQLDALFRKKGH